MGLEEALEVALGGDSEEAWAAVSEGLAVVRFRISNH